MIISIRRWHRLGILLFFIITLGGNVHSQCSPFDIEPPADCEAAPLYCLQNLTCYSSDQFIGSSYQGWCGFQAAIHNPQYFRMVAINDTIEIHIRVLSCDQGPGLQSGILSNCPWNIPDVLSCVYLGEPDSLMILMAEVTIGESYWLLIDGSSASICHYTIEYIQGIYTPTNSYQIDPEQTHAITDSICPGFNFFHVVTGPPTDSIVSYYWTLEWNNRAIVTTEPELMYNLSTSDPVGNWNVCVKALNGSCDTAQTEACVQIEIVEPPDVIKPTETYCPEDFPFNWGQVYIPQPGTYMRRVTTPDGCRYDSVWTIDAYPESEVGILDTVVCDYEFNYEGEVYDVAGVYLLEYPNQSIHGCDSVAELHLRLEKAEVFIETIFSDSNSILTPQIIELIPVNNTFSYMWYTCGFSNLLSTSRSFEIDSSGCYCLIMDSGACRDTICSFYETTAQDSGCIIIPDTVCIGDQIVISYAGGDSNATLHWLVELPDGDTIFFSDTDTISITNDSSDCYHVSLTIVNDTSSITCRDSFCNEANPLEGFICCDDFLCDTCTYLIFNMNGLPPWTIIYAAGSVIDTLENVQENPYEHRVCLPDGVNSVNYTFIEFSNEHEICPGQIFGFNTVQHRRYIGPVPEIAVTDSVLCAPSGYLSYNWHDCANNEILSQDECYRPSATGCYCADIQVAPTCILTSCADFISDTDAINFDPGITVFPNPSSGRLYVHLNEQFIFPAKWILFDQIGIQLRHGMFASAQSEIFFADISKGLYFLEIKNKNGDSGTVRFVIE